MRILRKSPGFSLIVIAVLALGIGANTALFSIVDRVLLHPFPFPDLDRLVEFKGWTQEGRQTGTSPAETEFFANNTHSVDQAAHWRWQNLVLSGVDNADYVYALEVSQHLFDILGVKPALGRTFIAQDFASSAAPAVVIGDRLWRQHFNADPAILGRQILLDGKGYAVIGVMGPEFSFINPTHQAWIPSQAAFGAEELKHAYNTIARLRPGATVRQLQQEIDAVTPALPPSPDRKEGWHAQAVLFTEGITAPYRRALLTLWWAVGLVLLIACANAANLLMARASERRREFAIRASLGAGRRRLIREILAETSVLGILAGVVGIALAFGLLRLLVVIFPGRLPVPQLDRASINFPVLALTCGISLLTTFACSIPAVMNLWRSNLTVALGGASRTASANRGANRTRTAMIALEAALSLILLVGAGLMLHTLHRLFQVRLGFEPQHLLTARVAAPPQIKPTSEAQYYARMLGEARSLPGVEDAGITTILPFGNLVATISFTVEGRVETPEQKRSASHNTYLREISPDYFSTLGVRLLRGRDFNAGDTARSPRVVIVNDELARVYWPGEDPIGKRVSRKDRPAPEDWATVIGVVESIKHRSLRTDADVELYVPITQQMMGAKYTNIVVRAYGDPLSVASALRKRIHDVEPGQPVTEIQTMQTLITESAVQVRFHTLLLEIFAGLALALAVTGIFAVVSYSVTQRTREIGIRGALGATRRDIAGFVVAIALRPVAFGLCVGVAGGLAATRLLQSELFETTPADPFVFGAVIAVLLGTTIAASALPAWRAAGIDPAEVLRAE